MIGTLIARSKVLASFDCLNRRDIDSFLENWHDEAVFQYPGDMSVSGTFEGKKAVAAWFEKYLDQFPTLRVTPRTVSVHKLFDLVGTNVVTVCWDEELTNKEGEQFSFAGVIVITLKHGKATHARDYIFETDEMQRKAWGE